MDDPDRRELVDDLHDHLRATGELPVDREANRWLGEAEAVADDVAGADASRTVLRRRVEQVVELLDHVDGTGNPDADAHVAAARDAAERLLERL